MPEVGIGGPDPYRRRFDPETYAQCYFNFLERAKLADQAGFSSFWTTEHHFQREGYETVPNVLMLGVWLAQHTSHLKFGAMVHPIPTWHPLRFAEDFAIADIMTNGRMIFGAGRGSVGREAEVFGASFGRRGDSGDQANRLQFEEQMDIMKLAWSGEDFSYRGQVYEIPPEGITETGTAEGKAFDKLTVLPIPTHPVEIWQALNSPATADYAARNGHRGIVSYVGTLEDIFGKWDLYRQMLEKHRGAPVRLGEDRVLVVRMHIGSSKQAAIEEVRPHHDERFRFLGGQRPIHGYRDEQGQPFPMGRLPTVEESVSGGGWLVGTASEVVDGILQMKEKFGVEYILPEVEFPGMTQRAVLDQIEAMGEHVIPCVGAQVPQPLAV
jgi:alkanesulfonate monooxygenase SsuD/methylene tetrahydromethanopterin reductase-like flavin-dependent oxidoreductase (luciferase family)